MLNGSKIPHSLKLVIFFLRVALGFNLFYLGFTALFSPKMESVLSQKALGPLYAWLRIPSNAWLVPIEWAFLVIGLCLIVGLMTRLAALAGVALVVFIYWPSINILNLNINQFINDELLVILCLLIILFGKAGSYMGLDSFFHFSMFNKKQ